MLGFEFPVFPIPKPFTCHRRQAFYTPLRTNEGVEEMSGDGELTQILTCDIEIQITGPTVAANNTQVADVLRVLATRIEKGGFDLGHHEVTDGLGKPAGFIYVDYSEGGER